VLPILFLFFSVQGFALDRIVDNAGRLSDSEKNELSSLIDSVSTKYNFDLVIVTETSILGRNKSPMEYADDFFDKNGYGLGKNRDGCIFLRVVNSRDYWFSTSGRGIKILNPTALGHMESATGKYLTGNNFYAASRAYIQAWDKFLDLEAKGRKFNFFYRWNILLVLISWLVSLGIGYIIVSIWKQGMNTALLKTQAGAYVIPGSFNFTAKKDSFLCSKVEKNKKESLQDSLSALKDIHTGSSGRSHGGGGGRR
jgi:uncharacterized protein